MTRPSWLSMDLLLAGVAGLGARVQLSEERIGQQLAKISKNSERFLFLPL